MSDILEKFNVFSEISEEFKLNIKLFHIFYDWRGKNVFFVTKEDKVFAFGYNYSGILGFGDNIEVDTPTEIQELSGKQIKQFFIGLGFVLALNEENHVFGWGMNEYGQLGRGYESGEKDYLKPEIIPELENIIEISCGEWHSLVLNEENNVFSWGFNRWGQVGCGKQRDWSITRPVQLKELPKIKSIHCSRYQSFAVTFDELVYSWGYNGDYCLGHETAEIVYEPKLIIGLNNVISVGFSYKKRDYSGSGYDLTYFLTKEENVYFCGKIGEKSKLSKLFSQEEYEYQKTVKILKTDLKFQSLQTIKYELNVQGIYIINSELLALSEETVYYLKRNLIKKTEYKTFFDYSLNERGITFKTYEMKFSDRFEKLSDLGSGSFGTVIKVKNKLNKSFYAIKVIKESNEKVIKEVQMLSKCREEYVVKCFDSWIENNKLFIQMELCSDNLKNIIKEKNKCFERKELEPMTKTEFFIQMFKEEISMTEYFISSHLLKEILECVQYLHEMKPEPIIHRDLKPANILVNYESKNNRFIKLCDFGLATFDDQFKTVSHTDNVGTLKYVSPEVLSGTSGRANYTTKADIFSLGFILCDLFDLDINSSYLSNQNKEIIEKWKILGRNAEKMRETIYKQRPTCSDLLSQFEFWGIREFNSNYKKSGKYKESVNQMEKFENNFFYNYFIEKALV